MFRFLLIFYSVLTFASDKNHRNEDISSLKTELLIQQNEKKAMSQLNKLINKQKGTPLEADLLFRKAELYMRMSKTDRFFDIHRESSTIVRLAPKRVHKANPKRNIRAAISIYENLIRRHKNYRDLDLVLFNNGFARQQLGQIEKSESNYLRVISDFPHSNLVPESHLAIGEMRFDKNNFNKAKYHYEAIKKYPQSRVYPYGRYKLAWALYNLESGNKAISELEAVIAYSQKSENSKNHLDLKNEALNDLVLFFSDTYPSKNALSYFRKVAGDKDAVSYVLKLAKLYKRHGKLSSEQRVLKDIIADMKSDPNVSTAYDRLIRSHNDSRQWANIRNELESFFAHCDVKMKWNRDNPELVQSCQKTFDGLALHFIKKWDEKDIKQPNVPQRVSSLDLAYRLYLERAIGKDQEPSVRYAFAEFLYRKKNYKEASENYYLVAQRTNDKKIKHDASYASIFTLQKSVQDKWTEPESEKRYMELAAFYIQEHPKGKFVEKVDFKRAFIVYDNARYAEAAPLLKKLGEKYSKKKQGRKAQDLYLDILNINKDYSGIKSYTTTLLGQENLPERKKKLKSLYEQSYFAEIQSLETKLKTKEAIDSYRKFAIENQTSPLADKAMWNRIQLVQKTSDLYELAIAANEMNQFFPNSQFTKDALILSAQAYEDLGELSHAKNALGKLKKLDKQERSKWELLEIQFSFLLGEKINHEAKLLELAKNKNYSLKSQSLLWFLKEQGRLSVKAKKYLEENAKPEYKSQIMLERAQDFFRRQNYREAFKISSKVISKKSKSLSEQKAQARFLQAQILSLEHKNQSVKARPERIALVVGLKTEKLEKTQKAFQAAISYSQDPKLIVDSLVALSELYTQYSNDIRSMKLPKEVPPQDAKAFYAEIENLAMPIEEKGVETMEDALKQAQKLALYDGSISLIREKLAKLNLKKPEKINWIFQLPDYATPEIEEVGS